MKIKFVFIAILLGCNGQNDSKKIIPLKPVSKSWIGKWERQIWQNGAVLKISAIKDDSIQFILDAASGGHTGEVEGWALVNDNIANYADKNESDSCHLEFKLSADSIISIKQEGCTYTAGVAVTYEGNYKNKKLLPKDEPKETLLSLGILNTGIQDSIFKSLVGNKYAMFVNSTQLTSEDKDLDSLYANVYSSGVMGLFTVMENIIMIDSANHIWAAVIDDDKVYYFTNKENYKNRLPKTIEVWRENFKEHEVVYQ